MIIEMDPSGKELLGGQHSEVLERGSVGVRVGCRESPEPPLTPKCADAQQDLNPKPSTSLNALNPKPQTRNPKP